MDNRDLNRPSSAPCLGNYYVPARADIVLWYTTFRFLIGFTTRTRRSFWEIGALRMVLMRDGCAEQREDVHRRWTARCSRRSDASRVRITRKVCDPTLLHHRTAERPA